MGKARQTARDANSSQTVIWCLTVPPLSALCYLPTLAERRGFPIPHPLLSLKFLFVLVPLAVSLIFVAKERRFRQWGRGLFRVDNFFTGILISLAFAGIGICSTAAHAAANPSGTSDFGLQLAAAQFVYLLVMAAIEEAAWRGFLLDKLSAAGEKIRYALFSGAVWAVWHIPMWSIRNMLGLRDIFWLFIWTLLLSVVLGRLYYKCHNILLCALLHAVFNAFFLAPMAWNVTLMAVIIAIGFAWKTYKGGPANGTGILHG